MNEDRTKRKLTAIFSADVVGYSRLMEEDEAWTIQNLEENKRLISKLIEEYQGRIIDAPGDNLLAEFNSVINAVECAVKIQQDLKKKNDNLIESRRMHFRIGINLGDVVEEDGRIYGNGVNIAARLEGLTDPGGICISRRTYDVVKTRLDLGYEYLGEHNVKNISEPVRVYRVLMGSENTGKVIGEKKASEMVSRRLAMTTFIALIIIAAGSLVWMYSHQPRKIEQASQPEQTPIRADVKEATKSIAVLPFDDLSPEKDQEYFVDGLSEEIINSLAKIPGLSVTSRTSAFSFKDKDRTVQEITSVLGVAHILEGSVRKAGNTLRVTAQLIRAADDRHLWSDQYDRELKDIEDILSIQGDIAKNVANELKVALGVGESLKQAGDTENLKAYELYLVAQGQFREDEWEKSLQSIDAALSLDPKFALAWAVKARSHIYNVIFGPANHSVPEIDAALNAAQRAIELEPNLAAGYYSLGFVKTNKGEWIEAESAYRKALEMPTETLSGSEFFIAVQYSAAGNFKKAHELLEEMKQNDPLHPTARGLYMLIFAFLGDIKRAEKEYEDGKELLGTDWYHGNTFITNIRLGYGKILPGDIVYSNLAYDIVKEHLDTPEAGLASLRQLYSDSANLSSADLIYVGLCAAYFGDPDFAMDAVEKGIRIDASGFFWFWLPVMHEVRQLPRFKEFVREIGLVDYWEKFGWPDLCHPTDDGNFVCD